MKKYLKSGLLVFICILFLGGLQVNAQDIRISAQTNTIYENQKIQLNIISPGQKTFFRDWKCACQNW